MGTPHYRLLSEAGVKGHMSQEIFVLVSGNGCFHFLHNDQEMSFVLRGDGPGYSGARGSLGGLQGVESLLGQSLNSVSPQDQCIVSCKRELGGPREGGSLQSLSANQMHTSPFQRDFIYLYVESFASRPHPAELKGN